MSDARAAELSLAKSAMGLTDDMGVSFAELSDATGFTESFLADLAHGPFAPDLPGGRLRLRVAFGLAVLAAFGTTQTLSPNTAIQAAVEAASSATFNGNCSLVVGWRGTTPGLVWMTGRDEPPPFASAEPQGSPLPLLQVVIPADRSFSNLVRAIGALRQPGEVSVH
jgi:hypothetical protein